MPEPETNVAVGDILQFDYGRVIVTRIATETPDMPYRCVSVNGIGVEYGIFHHHKCVVVGHAEQDHPALVKMRKRNAERAA